MFDIESTQVLHKEIIFKKALSLFHEKWAGKATDVDVFLLYFERNPCSELSYGWYEGHVEGLPSHSNSLESTHKHIKCDPLLTTKKPLRHFLGNIFFF